MSTFLGFSTALIPMQTTPSQVQATLAAVLSSYGWQIVRQAVNYTSVVTNNFTNPINAFQNTTAPVGANAIVASSATVVPSYIGFNYVAGFTPTALYVGSDWINPQYSPLTFTIDWSDNGSAWNTFQTVTGQNNWQFSERRKFTISGASSHPYWRINVSATNSGTTCYLHELTFEDANGNWMMAPVYPNGAFFDCIPPSTEVIGNANTREVLRVYVGTTNIWWRAIQETFMNWPQAIGIWGFAAGAVTQSLTLNGTTVSYVGLASNTAGQNARGLYEACQASVNANFTMWNWVWTPRNVVQYGSQDFLLIAKTPATNVWPTSSVGCTAYSRTQGVINAPMTQASQFMMAPNCTIDLSNGFIYFLQICSRGLALSTKTNSSYYTPIHACYGDNTLANAQIPTADLAPYGIPCTIIELLVGSDDVVANTGATAYLSHWWGTAQAWNSQAGLPPVEDYTTSWGGISIYTVCSAPFGHHHIVGQLQDFTSNCSCSWNSQGTYWGTSTMVGEGMFSGADAGQFWSVHKLGCNPNLFQGQVFGSNGPYAKYFGPGFPSVDWYKYSGSAIASENLLVAPIQDFTAMVSTSGTTTDTTINVVSTTGFPSSGWIILEGEIINYTSLTSTSFVGCVRGKYGTVPIAPLNGTTIYIGAWFVFMVQGLLFAGYQTPS
jgi:hypothetical protein